MSRRTPVLYRFLESLFRHRWIFLLSVLVVTTVTAVALVLRGQTFTATAMTQVVTDDIQSALGNAPNYGWSTAAQVQSNKLNDLLNDNQVGGFLDSALTSAQLSHPISVDPMAADPRYLELRKHLSASPVSDNTFEISLVWPDKDDAGKIVAAVRAQYVAEVGQDRSAQALNTGRFLDQQIANYSKRLQTAEDALTSFKEEHAGASPEMESSTYSQLSSLQSQLDQAQISGDDANRRAAALKQELRTLKPTSLLESMPSQNPAIVHLQALESQLSALQVRYTDLNPAVIQKKQELADYTRSLTDQMKSHGNAVAPSVLNKMTQNPAYQEVQQAYTDATIAQAIQTEQISNLKKRMSQYQAMLATMPAAEKLLADKMREYDVLKTQYTKLTSKREEVRTQANLDSLAATSTLRDLDRVYPQPTLTKTKEIALLAGSVILGLIVGIIILIISEWMNTSLRYETDTEYILGVPVLVVLPEVAELRALEHSSGKRMLSAPTTPA